MRPHPFFTVRHRQFRATDTGCPDVARQLAWQAAGAQHHRPAALRGACVPPQQRALGRYYEYELQPALQPKR